MIRLLKIGAIVGTVAGAAVWAGGAQAGGAQGNCTATGYTSSYAAECSGAAVSSGAATTANDTLRTLSSQTVGMIGDRISSFTAPSQAPSVARGPSGGTGTIDLGAELSKLENSEHSEAMQERGIAAGDMQTPLGVWMNVGYSNIHVNDVITTGERAGIGFNGDVWSVMIGADYQFTDKFMAGLATGYESTDLETGFNQGTLEGEGYTIAPYAVYRIDDNYSIDASVGYTFIDYDLTRTDLLSQTAISGSTDAERYFGATNVNANYMFDQLWVNGRFGLLYVDEDQDDYTETGTAALTQGSTSSELGEVQTGLKVGYDFGGVVPYALAMYRYDFENDGASDDDDFVLGGGLNVDLGNITAGLEGSTVEGRDSTAVHSVAATVRVEF